MKPTVTTSPGWTVLRALGILAPHDTPLELVTRLGILGVPRRLAVHLDRCSTCPKTWLLGILCPLGTAIAEGRGYPQRAATPTP